MYERIYTIGCFDFLHEGHINLINSMKKMGKTIIAGIHDNNSLKKLKNLSDNDYQDILIRVKNLKKHVDHVYIISDTDPSLFLYSIISKYDNKNNACFVRADDNINFPGINIINGIISIKYLPYTQNISSTIIRNNNKKNEI